MKFSQAKKSLLKRREWLKNKAKNDTDTSHTFYTEESQAIALALKCIEIVKSYGMVSISRFGYPVFAGQEKQEHLEHQLGVMRFGPPPSLDRIGMYNTGDR